MNAFPSWIHRIPEMIETLALAGAERIDRQAAERWFDLRATAAQALLGRMGAEWCGHALMISGAVRMARLREVQEHPDWKWEGERRRAIRDRVEATRGLPAGPWSPVTAELRRNLDQICVTELPATIKLHPPRSLSTARIWSSPAATGSTRQNTGQRLRNFAAAHRTAARSAACRRRNGFGSRQLGGDAAG